MVSIRWNVIVRNLQPAQGGLQTFGFLAAIMMLSGCRTARQDVAQETRPPDDIAEARRNVADSLIAVQSTLDALDHLTNVNGPWPPDLVNQFTIKLARLEADSFKFRGHARAMQSRGDAYFDEWQLHLSQSREPEASRQAGERHEALRENFGVIQHASQRASVAFKPFLSDLHALRRAFEATSNASNSTKELIRKATNEGQQVRLELETIRRGLDSAGSNLARVKVE